MKLFNSQSRSTEAFEPGGDVVTMYVCGLTPYAPSHVGHAMRAVVFDVLRRYLEYSGHEVKHVENFTDIDDKMIDGAAREGITTGELAERNIETYFEEMDALNVLRANLYPRATHEIPGMIEMIEGLVERGYAYAVDGDVYFSVRKDEEYGKLSGRELDSMIAGARVEPDEKKADQMDFALWKGEKPGEPSWGSPWGPGRPGWHIECSAMALHYLGETVDIHGGGQDLVFPHHENEIAQTENYTGVRPMARFWMHNGWMKLGDDKMSKSTGNFITIGEALERFSPDALRLFFLASHYRSPLTYSDESVESQERAADRLRNAVQPTGASDQSEPIEPSEYRDRFVAAMDDDLNTPQALAVLFDLAREINRAAEAGRDVDEAQEELAELAGVLGLTLKPPEGDANRDFLLLAQLVDATIGELTSNEESEAADRMRGRLEEQGIDVKQVLGATSPPVGGDATSTDVSALVQTLIESRADLRAAKRFDLADGIRDRLAESGCLLEDTPSGTEWRRSAS